jgi:hypothetical protein
MKKLLLTLAVAAAAGLAVESRAQGDRYTVPTGEISASDPFVLADPSDNTYYLYSTGGGGRILSRASKDLRMWTEPFVVMEFPETHWAGSRAPSWATEVFHYQGKYYLFTTSHNDATLIESIPGRCDIPRRATQIYVADSPRGPFVDFTGGRQHTPLDWASLDGTLWVEDGVPYMIFCHEWLQTIDGTMEAVRLPDDLGVPTEAPFQLFRASNAPWPQDLRAMGGLTNGLLLPGWVTDGCWLFRTQTGRLGMLWSSWGTEDRYALGVSYSESGRLAGPWIHEEKPIFEANGGHGMLFRTFDGKLMLSLHWVNPLTVRATRRPAFLEMDDSGDRLVIRKEPGARVIY